MKRNPYPKEVRLFYLQQAMDSLREAEAYLLCAGAGGAHIDTHAAYRSTYKAYHALRLSGRKEKEGIDGAA